jgi:hypothetical protein
MKGDKKATFLIYFDSQAEYAQFKLAREQFKKAGFSVNLFPMFLIREMQKMIEENSARRKDEA